MKHVKHILDRKGHDVTVISPGAKVLEALQLMAEKEIGALLVVEDEKLCGIVSERDYARKVILKGRASKDAPVRDIMTTDILYVDPDQTIEECMALMSEKHIRHLPVLKNEKLEGIISIGDVVKAVIEEREFVIKQLEHYIHGR